MRARHFGARSYDDDDMGEEELDLSGFVTSAAPNPPVVERKRARSSRTSVTRGQKLRLRLLKNPLKCSVAQKHWLCASSSDCRKPLESTLR